MLAMKNTINRKMKTDLSIIIISHNTENYLRDCLKSVHEKVVSVSYEIIVVDNVSTDNSVHMMRSEFPQIKLIVNKENTGFGRACNQAAGEAEGAYLLFLNPDTEIINADFDSLFGLFENNAAIGVIVPVISYNNGLVSHKGIAPVPGLLDMSNALLFRYSLNDKHRYYMVEDDTGKDHYASGCCLLMKSEVFRDVGGFDENFFLYFEDVDLSLKIKQKGLDILPCTEFNILHQGSGSIGQYNYIKYLSIHQSSSYFYKKHYGRSKYIVLRFILFTSIFREMAVNVVKFIAGVSLKEGLRTPIIDQYNILKWHIADMLQKKEISR